MRLWRDIASTLVRWRARQWFQRFDGLVGQCRRVQEEALLAKVARNADSDFGRDHGFAHVESTDDFRRQVPLCEYQYLRPYVDRVRAGETSALFGPGERVLMFAMTSGTTAEPKYIPITQSFLDDYRHGWLIWGWGAYRHHQQAFRGHMLNVVSRPDEEVSPAGIPCGAVSGLMAEMQPWLVRGLYATPAVVNEVPDTESKYYLILRLALLRQVSLCATPNPSTLLRLSEVGNERAGELIRDIEQGGLSERCQVPEHVRRRLRWRLRPHRRRAGELAQLLDREGKLLPRDYWPELDMLAVWKGGTVSLYLPRLAECYGPVPVRDLGLIASEGRMSIPLGDEGSAGVLDLMHQFFEFIPEEEMDSEQPETLLAHEVEVGQRYGIVLTTSGGCYRYNIMDHVEVVDFYGGTPVVEFLNKGDHISSLTGEKLTEYQVVRSLERVGERLGVPVTETLTAAPVWDQPPYYVLLAAEGSLDPGRWVPFVAGVDEELSLSNVEYRQKRKSGRLAGLRLRIVPADQFAAVLAHRQRRLRTPEQVKHVFLVPDVHYHEQLDTVQEVACRPVTRTAEKGL